MRMSRSRRIRRLVEVVALVCAASFAVMTAVDSAEPTIPPNITRLTRTSFDKFFLSYSPDGSHIVYSRHYPNRRAANLVLVGTRIVRADGSNDHPLLTPFDAEVQIQEHPTFSPDGKRLLISGGGNDTGNSSKDIFVCDIDPQFAATQLRKVVSGAAVQFGEEPCWSPDGKRIAYVTTSEQLWTVDADGKNRSQILQAAGQYLHQPAWSPDGQWIAFASDRDGNIELYKVRRDGTDLIRLTNQAGIDCRPKWSRDGRWLLFSSNRDGNFDVHLMRSDGSELRNLTRHPAMDDHAAWAADGRHVAFVSMRDGGFDIYRLALPDDIRIESAPTPTDNPTVNVDGLVAHFNFDQAATEFVADQAGRHRLQLEGAKIVRNGDGGSLEFDGQKSFGSVGNAEGLRIKGPLTISLWVRPESVTGNGYLIAKHGWNVYLGADFIPRFETRNAADTAWETLSAAKPVNHQSWSQVVAVFDPKAEKLLIYVNGRMSTEKKRTDGAIGAVVAYPLELGTYNVTRSQWFHGRLDEVRLYNRALSATEVEQQFREQATCVSPDGNR